jgi:hypothetical protein
MQFIFRPLEQYTFKSASDTEASAYKRFTYTDSKANALFLRFLSNGLFLFETRANARIILVALKLTPRVVDPDPT